jgi:hypothetical protein
MSYTNFNRHANMDKETLFEIGDIINDVRWDCSFDLSNELFGLYDGYLYDDILTLAEKELETTMYNRIEKVINIVSKYPKL